MPNAATFTRAVGSGKTFVRIQFKKGDIDRLVADLNYASTPAVIQNAARVEEYGRSVLAYLKANFPSKNRSASAFFANVRAKSKGAVARKPLNLREGWQVKFYSSASVMGGSVISGSTLWGFYVSHRQQNSERVRTILASLESGSRAYTIEAQPGSALSFSPRGGSDRIARMKAEIPARAGYGFLAKTEKYADDLLARHGTYLEDELQRIVEKGSRMVGALRTFEGTRGAEGLDVLSSTPEAISALAKQKNPLKAVRIIKARMKSRRFKKSYR